MTRAMRLLIEEIIRQGEMHQTYNPEYNDMDDDYYMVPPCLICQLRDMYNDGRKPEFKLQLRK